MNTTTCSQCGHEIEFGQYPFCPHGWTNARNAQAFDPIVVWIRDSDNQPSFPGQANEPCPAGYHEMSIRNLQENDRFCNRMNALERQKAEAMRDLNYQAFDEQTKRRRDDVAARIRGNAKAEAMFRRAREWADKRRDEKRSKQRNLDPHFHNQVLSYDSGNRPSYSGPETGWRERKG